MNQNVEELILKINKMYKSEKSMKFILHLIHAYIPLESKSKKFVEPENKLSVLNCCLSDCIIVGERKMKTLEGNFHEDLVKQAYTGFETNKCLCEDALMALEIFVK
jgi:hypothetical protein